MTLTRLCMIGVATVLWVGPAGAENKLDGVPGAQMAPDRAMAQPASSTAEGQACLSLDVKDNGLSYRGFPSSTGHTQEITTSSADTFVTYTCPIAQGVVVMAKLGRTLLGGCRFADRYEMTFIPSARRLKIDGTRRDCVVAVLSTRGG